MDEIAPCKIEWLWPGKIPQGRLTVLCGDGGVGKSFASLAVAATLSRGAPWPDQPGDKQERGTTLLVNAEDHPGDTLRVRLDACEADCRYIHIIDGVQRSENAEQQYFNLLDDIGALEDKIKAVGATLCVVDPIGAFLAGVDSHKDAAVRAVLGPLAGLASRTNCAILAVLPINKGSATKVSHRVCGSVAFTNAARMAWFVCVDPDNEHRRLMLPFKHNIIQKPSGIGFEIVDGGVRWFPEPVALDADVVLAMDGESRSERAEAEEWLEGLLARGPLSGKEIQAAAVADCHHWRTVERAKKALKITSTRTGFGAGGVFTWELPADRQEVAVNEPHRPPTAFGGQCDNGPETAISPIDRQSQLVAVNGAKPGQTAPKPVSKSVARATDCGPVLATDPIDVDEADGDEDSNDDAHVNPGWEPGPWADRLDHMADRCEADHPDMAEDHRRRAAAIRRKHDTK